MKRNLSAAVMAAVLSGGVVASAATAATGPPGVADLRADVDRDGIAQTAAGTGTDDTGEDAWSPRRGAIVLPNIDDDARRCPVKDAKGKALPFKQVVGCNDASDTIVNTQRDAADLAPLRTVPLPNVSDRATGTVALTGRGARYGRLFVKAGAAWRLLRPADRLSAGQLRGGAELGLEATDVVRDVRRWNGELAVRFTVSEGGSSSSDTVVARVAPVLTHHHAQRTERVLVTRVEKSGISYDKLQHAFVGTLAKQVRGAGITAPLFTFSGSDVWAQDFFEPGYASMPAPNGRAQAMRILIRSAQLDRSEGEQLWRRLRGPDVGAVQVPDVPLKEDWTLSSMGNLETIPPYRSTSGTDYPAGRIVQGWRPDTRQKPAATMTRLLTAQGVQRPLLLDTSWLYVGHVDEFLQFLPANTPRGWRLAVSDPRGGIALLRRLDAAGHGGTRLFSLPKRKGETVAPALTVHQAVKDRNLLLDNATAAKKIDANVATLKRETGLTDTEIVRIPALYGSAALERVDPRVARAQLARGPRPQAEPQPNGPDGRAGRSAPTPTPKSRTRMMGAFIPGSINGLLLAPDRVLAPRPWGPVVGGKDVFADAVTTAYRSAGMQVRYIDDWHTYHTGGGEVHCGTNTLRTATTPWWVAPAQPGRPAAASPESDRNRP